MDSTLMTLWSPKFASQPAVFIPDGPGATYGQLQDQVDAVTTALREGGVQAGEHLSVWQHICVRNDGQPVNPDDL